MKILITESRGYYQKGDVVDMTPGIALQLVRENRATPYTAPTVTPASKLANLKAMAQWEPKVPAPQNRKLSKSEIRNLYSKSFQGKPFAHGRTQGIK